MLEKTESGQQKNMITPRLSVVAWEITKRCNLYCAHCRGSSDSNYYSGEFTTEECFGVVDKIIKAGKPILILTGGEPLLRPDLVDMAKVAADLGMRVAVSTNGTLVTEAVARELFKAGVVDGPGVIREVLTSIKRAGADIIITYFAREALEQGYLEY